MTYTDMFRLCFDSSLYNQLLYVFRKYSKLSPEQAVFIFTENNKLLDFTHDVSYVYRKYKNKDNFLYLYMAFENAFG